eukprot:scaffold1146_cov399-Prasinococcus_capsulatus_cf.AAC.79
MAHPFCAKSKGARRQALESSSRNCRTRCTWPNRSGSRLKQITFQIDKASLDGTQVLSTAAETRSVETLLTARGSSPSLSQCANVRTRTLSQ